MAKVKLTIFAGQRFDRVTVLDSAVYRLGRDRACLCKCDCGKEWLVRPTSLYSGAIKSCGCYSRDKLRERKLVHGHAKKGAQSPEYMAWYAMHRRCSAKSFPQYKDYGGRGISVCPAWKSFEAFLQDMGEKPEGTSLDRINNDGNYSPENCRWATRSQQARNKTSVRKVLAFGKTRCVAEWSECTGIASATIIRRLNSGWPSELALSLLPKRGTNGNLRK